MSGKDSSRETRTPSSPPSTTPPPIEPVAGPAEIVTPNRGNPIVAGLLGVVLVSLAGVGGGYLHTHPNQPSAPSVDPEPAHSEPLNPTTADALPAEREPANQPSQVESLAAPPPTILQTPARKRSTVDAKKPPLKAGVKEIGAVILPPPPTPPAQAVNSAPQPPEPQPSNTPPQPAPEKHEERKEPSVTVQPAPLVQVRIRDGMPIRMLLTEDVPSDAPDGLTVQFVVAGSVQVDNTTVIAKGAATTAAVAGHKKKLLGIGSAKVTYQLRTVQAVDSGQLKVRATSARSSDGPSTNQFEPRKGPTKRGFAALQGTEYIGYIDSDQTVTVRE